MGSKTALRQELRWLILTLCVHNLCMNAFPRLKGYIKLTHIKMLYINWQVEELRYTARIV